MRNAGEPTSYRFTPTDHTRVQRRPERGSYDRDLIYQIIDEALICHVAFIFDGRARIIPTTITRIDDALYIHGSNKNGMLTALAHGVPASICVTHTDAIVVGRSGFGCSLEYRSMVAFGNATQVDPEEKEAIMDCLLQDIIPGFGGRRLAPSELAATQVLRFPLSEVSAKVRNHGVSDVDTDYDLDIWAGLIPLSVTAGQPISDSRLRPEIPVPDEYLNYRRP